MRRRQPTRCSRPSIPTCRTRRSIWRRPTRRSSWMPRRRGISPARMASNTSALRIAVLDGDGISPEITAATLAVLRATTARWQFDCSFDEVEVGLKPLREHGTTFPESAFEAAKAADGVILGPVSHNDYPPAEKGGINPSGALRKRLDLVANIRPAKTRAQFAARFGKPADLVIVRENTEGFYADRNMHQGVGDKIGR